MVSTGHRAAAEKLSRGGELPGGTLAPPAAHPQISGVGPRHLHLLLGEAVDPQRASTRCAPVLRGAGWVWRAEKGLAELAGLAGAGISHHVPSQRTKALAASSRLRMSQR